MADIARIKGNIAKMIAQNAPEADIDAYVSSEGVSLDQLRAPSQAQQPDKYQQAAIDEQKTLKDAGIDPGAGYTRRLAHGATFGADNTVLAALQTPLEMFKRGVGPGEAYNYAKAREDQIMGDARKNTGALGTALEIGGGVGSGIGLARGGATFGSLLAPEAGIAARSLASAGDAAALGGFSGGMEGNGLAERGENALKGGALGLAVGGATPGVLGLLGAAASPVVSNIRAQMNPRGYAQSQIARAASESGRPVAQITDDLAQAAREGQGMFTLADAMGNPGQRMLSSVARAPGQGRTDVVNFLENRQAGQGRRVASSLAEGFDSPQTAAQTEARLTQARDTAANADYGAIRRDAQPVDVSNVISHIDDILAPYGVAQNVAANDAAAGSLANLRRRLTNGDQTANDFNLLQRVRGDLSDEIQQARQSGAGNRARLLGGALRELDTALENSSSGFRDANRNFAQRSRNIEAVGQGRDAAMRGRTEDVIPRFQGLTPEGQQAFRSGYVDPLIAQTQGAAFGVNKARPLINDAFQAESNVMAPGAGLMQRRLGRENTMFETRNAAMGGSKTADNLADQSALSVDPTLVGNILSGNWMGAARSILQSGSNAFTGNTPQVRQELANILLQNGVSAGALNRMINETMTRVRFIQNMTRNLGRGGSGGLAVAVSGQNQR